MPRLRRAAARNSTTVAGAEPGRAISTPTLTPGRTWVLTDVRIPTPARPRVDVEGDERDLRPARAHPATECEQRARRAARRAIPSALCQRSPTAAHCAVSVGGPARRARPLHRAAARAQPRPCAPNCVATKSGSSVPWLTKTNRQRGCAGKSPPRRGQGVPQGPSSCGQRDAGRSGSRAAQESSRRGRSCPRCSRRIRPTTPSRVAA